MRFHCSRPASARKASHTPLTIQRPIFSLGYINRPEGRRPHRENNLEIDAKLEQWVERGRRKAAAWVNRAFPSLAVSVLALDAAGLESRRIPELFSRQVREIPLGLNDDLLDLYGRAAAVLDNRFAFFHRSQKFEPEIAWEPPESPAWVAELHAFDYALDLALTYRISGEEIYARCLRYLLADWIASNPPLRGTGWLPGVVARRIHNWILASDLARDNWESDAEFLQVVGSSLALQCTFLGGHAAALRSVPEMLDASRALLLASRFFHGARGSKFRSVGIDLLLKTLASPFNSRFPWPGFRIQAASTILNWLLFDAESAQRDELLGMLRSALSRLEGLLLPGRALPLFGPGGRTSDAEAADMAALTAVLLADSTWKDIAGEFGILPYMLLGEPGWRQFAALPGASWRAQNRFDPARGVYRLVGGNESALVVAANDSEPENPHEDFLNFELTLEGQRVLVDSGAYTPEPDEYFSGARAHNVLLVDGGAFGGPGPHRLLVPEDAWEMQPGRVRLKLRNLGCKGLTHERFWFCLDGRFWVIVDRVQGEGKYRLQSVLHFFPTFALQAIEPNVLARSRACCLTIIPVGSPGPKLLTTQGDNSEFAGWYAPDFGLKYPTSVLRLDWDEVELPWAGGVLLAPGEESSLRSGGIGAEAKQIDFELSGTSYSLCLA